MRDEGAQRALELVDLREEGLVVALRRARRDDVPEGAPRHVGHRAREAARAALDGLPRAVEAPPRLRLRLRARHPPDLREVSSGGAGAATPSRRWRALLATTDAIRLCSVCGRSCASHAR